MNKSEICRFTCSSCEKMRTESAYHNGICSVCRERSKREDSVLNNIPEYGSQSSLNFDEWQRRCGALNTTVTL
jgi:hypothetical protein